MTRHGPVHLLCLSRQTEPDHHRPKRLVQAGVFKLEFFQEKSQHLLGLWVVLLGMSKERRMHEQAKGVSIWLAGEASARVVSMRGEQKVTLTTAASHIRAHKRSKTDNRGNVIRYGLTAPNLPSFDNKMYEVRKARGSAHRAYITSPRAYVEPHIMSRQTPAHIKRKRNKFLKINPFPRSACP